MSKWISTKDKLPLSGKPVIVLKARRPDEYPPDIVAVCVLNKDKKHKYEFDFKPLPEMDSDSLTINGSHWFYMPPIAKWSKVSERKPKAGRPVILLTCSDRCPWPNKNSDYFLYVCRLRDGNRKFFTNYLFESFGNEYGINYFNATHWIYLPDEPEQGND